MNRPLPVLYVASSEGIDGSSRILLDIVAGLNRDRFAPLIVAPAEGPLEQWANDHRIDVEVVRGGDWTDKPRLLHRTASFVRLGRAFGVGLVHAMAPSCYRAAGLAGRILPVPRICHLSSASQTDELSWSFRFGPEAVITGCEGQSRSVAPDVRAARPGCRIVAIPHGVDARADRPAPVNWEAHQQLRGRASHVVVIAGQSSDVKGYPSLLRAAARISEQLPECVFLALGGEPGGSAALARYEQMASALGLGRRVRFLGYRSDVADVLRAADLVVLPSLDEGLPLAALEAMACAKPIVATRGGGIPEAVIDGVTGLLVPANEPDQLASAILHVLSDRHGALRMGTSARGRVLAQFSMTRFVTAIEALYTEVLGRPTEDDFVSVDEDREVALPAAATNVFQS